MRKPSRKNTTPISTDKGPVFVDASAFYAARDRTDRNYTAAISGFRLLQEEGARLVTTDHVVAETATLVRRKLGYAEAKAPPANYGRDTGLEHYGTAFCRAR